MKHNEDTRVKIPTILHLTRLGYKYLSLNGAKWDEKTNVFTDVFNESIQKINPDVELDDIKRYYDEIAMDLENEDLGQAFYEKLLSQSGILLIDFENFENNTFNVVTELPCKKDEDEFRPDITVLVNGMPLAFIEVKKPNNLDGIQAEHKRMETRFQNKKFRNFINITQFMVFSNNMEYEEGATQPLAGAFYSSTSYYKPIFNYFREEEKFNLDEVLAPLDDEVENFVLKDNNLVAIKSNDAFATNKNPDKPTNRIATSMFKKDRLAFLLRYSLAYVKTRDGLQKHIMRYPQIFATKAIENKLEEGWKKGIVWHTQGSGKTALTYYNVKHLTDYYQKKNTVAKFYFIVDRIDLLTQACGEFLARGLVVHQIQSKEAFAKDIKSTSVIHNDSGRPEITVVNIHKFKDDPTVTRNTDYNVNIQRVYFMDEVHRSYNPKGSFLHNLNESDPNAIKIGLTGTPLLGKDYNSRALFGEYIHKYYYNSSIQDGYTLRLIREEVETEYKSRLNKTLADIKLLKSSIKKEDLYADYRFVEPMLEYIVDDFAQARTSFDDNTIGAMVVCDSSKQALEMYRLFQEKYTKEQQLNLAAEPEVNYGEKQRSGRIAKTAQIILDKVGSKEERKEWVDQFKAGKIDILFVYNMLLTGFDAPRLKKLYVGRVVKAHNLLQTLTRVNRTYKDYRFGYVVDFAGIEEQFKKTSQDYFNELQGELGDELENFSELFLTEEDINQKISQIKDTLLYYNIENPEVFSEQISEINDRSKMLEINRALNDAKDLYNLIRFNGQFEMLDKLDFRLFTILSREASHRLSLINQKESLESATDQTNLLNLALEDIIFSFKKGKEEEMVLADKLRESMKRTREMLAGNFDQQDPEFISLKEELERLFKKKNLAEIEGQEEMEESMKELDSIYTRAKEFERQNQLIRAKYENDEKYARLHKRLLEKDPLTESEAKLFEVLNSLKLEVDTEVLKNSEMLTNESYAEKKLQAIVVKKLHKEHNLGMNPAKIKRVNNLLVKEYLNEFYGRVA